MVSSDMSHKAQGPSPLHSNKLSGKLLIVSITNHLYSRSTPGQGGAVLHPDADTSLASLQFTNSSMDGLSLDQVVQQIDKNMTSSMDTCDGKDGVRHSTPAQLLSASDSEIGGRPGRDRENGQRDGGLGGSEGVLELVGRELKPLVKSGIKLSHKVPITAAKAKTKSKVRNYNEKDF